MLGRELGLVRARQALDEARHKLLGNGHDIVDVKVGSVELHAGELGAVGQIDALVAEVLANLKNLVEAADNQHLEVQLRRDTHEQLAVERVVVRLEWQSSGTAGNSSQGRGLDLDELALVEEITNVSDHLAAGPENLTRLVVEQQVQVARAEALLVVLEAIVLGGQHVQRRRQQDNFGSKNGQLAFLTLVQATLGRGAARVADNADNITTGKVQVLLVESNAILLGVLCLAHDLHASADGLGVGTSADVVEDELVAGTARGKDTASDTDLAGLVDLAGLEVAELGGKVVRIVVDEELVGVRVGVVGLKQALNLAAADLVVLAGVEVLLGDNRDGGGGLLGDSGGSLSGLGLLLLVSLALLLATLKLRLGDLQI